MKARTIVEITGTAIKTIPKGTEFVIESINGNFPPKGKWDASWSACSGLGISSIYNTEFELIEDPH